MRRFTYRFVALAAALFLAGQATVVGQSRDIELTPAQEEMASLDAPPSDMKVATWVDREDATYKVGETVTVYVKATQDSYVTVLNIGSSGKVHVIFPNKYQTENRIVANSTLEIPGKNDAFKLKVGGPSGNDLIKVIVTNKPVEIVEEGESVEEGAFRAFTGKADKLSRDIAVELTEKPEIEGAMASKVIRISR